MSDHRGKSNERMISEFITGTCQLLQKTFRPTPTSDHMHALTMSLNPANKQYSFLSGSYAEFYIRPLNSCIDDMDTMLCKADDLACIGNYPVLPRDRTGLADIINCYKIESYHRYPGFVRIRVLGEMNYTWKRKRYDFNETADAGDYMCAIVDNQDRANFDNIKYSMHMTEDNTLPRIASSPAVKTHSNCDVYFSVDCVQGYFCPQWPMEAIEWSIRPRVYGWPTNNLISEVVQNGCHVVYAQHRACAEDKQQWRLSFSVAEVILLQSWTKIQQIVYHLLRFFAKRELIEQDCPKEDEILCSYHLKTLMLWTC